MLTSFHTPALAIALLVGLAVGVAELIDSQAPALPALGLILAAAAPLLFLIRLRFSPLHERRHPVGVSATMGLGCATIMIGIQRFGDHSRWLLVIALVLLCAWMLYQRYHLRSSRPKRRKH